MINSRSSSIKIIYILLTSLLFLVSASLVVLAQNSDNLPPTEDYLKLNDIKQNIDKIEKELNDAKEELKNEKDENKIIEIQQYIDQLTQQQDDYQQVFEKISLGGLETTRFSTPTMMESSETYDWQKELIQIVQPVFNEMRRMTEEPRKRDYLRLQQKEIDSRISDISKGLDYLQTIPKNNLTEPSVLELDQLAKEWHEKLNNLQREHDLVILKLQDLTDEHSFLQKFKNSVWDFISGRGLILVIAVTVFFGLISLFSSLMNFTIQLREKYTKTRKSSLRWRISLLAYQMITATISLLSMLMIIYASGDTVLFGLAILILVAFLFGTRNSIPKYYRKLRLFLNMAQAREGERIIYNGIPYKIAHINLYTVYLINPALDNGEIRLTVEELDTMISRPIKMDEIWFPTKVGDSVFMPDGTHATVIRQTPEAVYLDAFSNNIIYPTNEFINAKPRNISQGYSLTINFGISHQHFELEIEEVIDKIHDTVEEYTIRANEKLAQAIVGITVDFRAVNEHSSLVYTIILSVGPNSDGFYYSLPRLVQKACVKAAQKNGWKIPYTELILLDENRVE